MEIFTQIAKDYGLFVALVVYILWFFDKLLKEKSKENTDRETRYISVIDKLSDSFTNLTKEVEAIKNMIMVQRDDQEETKKKVANR